MSDMLQLRIWHDKELDPIVALSNVYMNMQKNKELGETHMTTEIKAKGGEVIEVERTEALGAYHVRVKKETER